MKFYRLISHDVLLLGAEKNLIIVENSEVIACPPFSKLGTSTANKLTVAKLQVFVFLCVCVFIVFFCVFRRGYLKQDNVHTNTEFVQCISTAYSICPYKYTYNQ